jgi:hypothetical protein
MVPVATLMYALPTGIRRLLLEVLVLGTIGFVALGTFYGPWPAACGPRSPSAAALFPCSFHCS